MKCIRIWKFGFFFTMIFPDLRNFRNLSDKSDTKQTRSNLRFVFHPIPSAHKKVVFL